ncbi:(2Fe-2S) ferredoxin domain-containing protein [Altericista sp. CCNU0014]|uniref:(2Fe-2S) ferredoxin domain-containing protein n=1 Tax=Altericista sp. CCNU0014 TaxID=3082949 RepID=UPI00384B9F9B
MSHTHAVPFRLIGQLEGYTLGQDGKVRRLSIATSQGNYSVKLTHDSRIQLLRSILNKTIQQGSWLEVIGSQKRDRNGDLKSLKAKQIAPAFAEPIEVRSAAVPNMTASPQTGKAKILVCQKSDCCKRGSAKLQKAIETAICDRDLGDRVCVKAVGCLKQCNKGPNIVIDKKSYRDVELKDVGHLLDRHFTPVVQESVPAA